MYNWKKTTTFVRSSQQYFPGNVSCCEFDVHNTGVDHEGSSSIITLAQTAKKPKAVRYSRYKEFRSTRATTTSTTEAIIETEATTELSPTSDDIAKTNEIDQRYLPYEDWVYITFYILNSTFILRLFSSLFRNNKKKNCTLSRKLPESLATYTWFSDYECLVRYLGEGHSALNSSSVCILFSCLEHFHIDYKKNPPTEIKISSNL